MQCSEPPRPSPPRGGHPSAARIVAAILVSGVLAVGATASAADLIVTTSQSLSAGTYTFGTLHVKAGATLTLQGNGSTGAGVVLNLQTLVVDAGGVISANGQGYAAGAGAGAGGAGNYRKGAGGGGHGGLGGVGGGSNGAGTSGAAFDALTTPSLGGCRGGSGSGAAGGSAGGAITLLVAGEATVNGTMTAGGGAGAVSGNEYAGGGGAGGTIRLEAASVAGTGSIQANGGAGGSVTYAKGGGGAGGRVVVRGDLVGALTLRARGGGASGYAGGAGTVALLPADGSSVSLWLDNGGVSGASTPLGAWTLDGIDITGAADLRVTSALQVGLVTVAGGVVTVDATLGTDAFVVTGGSTLRHAAGGGGFFVDVASDLLLDVGCTVNLDSLGSGSGSGAGAGGAGDYRRGAGGAGHGGVGGTGSGSNGSSAGGAHHGSIPTPATSGSGGGVAPGCAGGKGGGRARFAVGGTFTLAGLVTANGSAGGTSGNEYACGGGSGGSVRVTAGAIVGGGTVRANGGAGGNVSYAKGGGGAGGRIALMSAGALEVTTQAVGGASGAQVGGAGTVIRGADGVSAGALEAWGSGTSAAATPLPTGASSFTGLLVGAGATLQVPTGGSAAVDGPIRASTGGSLLVDGPITGASLLVDSGGVLLPSAGLAGFSVTVTGDATIAYGGLVTADGRGSGSGKGAAPGGAGTYRIGGGGGAYGGTGGTSTGSNGSRAGGAANGSITAPATLGSGGGTNTGCVGGAGGGIIRLTAGGLLTVDGTVTANGTAGGTSGNEYACGGAAGGTIVLAGADVQGIGTVRANGGAGGSVTYAAGGGGSGGRVVVEGEGVDGPTLQARGAGSGTRLAGAGTVLVRSPDGSVAELRVGNAGAGQTTPIVGGPYALGSLVVSGSAIAVIPSAHAIDLSGAVNVTGGTLRVNGATDAGSLTVGSGGVVTHDPGSSGLVLNLSGDVDVEAGGAISVAAMSTSTGTGVGGAGTYRKGGGGGSYGGPGGAGTGSNGAIAAGASYGSALAPTGLGSAGGASTGIAGGRGGGWVRLSAAGMVTVDGTISADGGAGTTTGNEYASGGGSGGTVFIGAASVAGAGLISAAGASGGNSQYADGGAGGGGRIQIDAPVSGPTLRARGGSGPAGSGAAGTILAGSPPSLIVDNDNVVAGTTTLPAATYALHDLTVQETANAAFASGSTVTVAGTVEAKSSGLLQVPATLTASNAAVRSAGRIAPTSGSNSFHLILSGDLTVEPGASIDGNGRGLGAGSGSGAGGAGSYRRGGGGGGYGCAGGAGGGSNGTTAGGSAYGSAAAPVDRGSGGGTGTGGANGAAGGGRVRVTVGGTAHVDGTVRADGSGGTTAGNEYGGGGGSGGTVVLQAARLEGAGSIRAHGGAGGSVTYAKGGGGGGGRVLIRTGVDAFTGTTTASGGGGYASGCAGSVVKVPTVPAITDLGASTGGGDGEVDLSFTEPAGLDPLLDHIEIVAHTEPITDANFWDAAPIVPAPPSPTGTGGVVALTATGLLPGSTVHFAARVVDSLGASSVLSNGASAQAGGDAIPPATIEDLAAAPANAGEAHLSWTAPADEGLGAASYDVRWAAGTFDWATATPVADAAPTPGPAGAAEAMTVTGLPTAVVTLAVRTVDHGGTSSATSNLAVADLEAPTVAITSPAEGATVSRSVTVHVDATDSVAVDRVRFLLDGALLGEDTTPAPGVDPANPSAGWAWELDLTATAAGAHTVTAIAADAWGNEATDAVTVTVEDSPPATPRITSPADGELVTVATVPVVGTSDAPATVTVTVDGAPTPVAAQALRTVDRQAEDAANAVLGCAATAGGLTLAAPAAPTNVAAGRPAVASSVYSTPTAATEAVDGVPDDGTTPTGYWLAKDGVTGASLTVDLGGPWEVTSIRLLNTAGGPAKNRGTADYRVFLSEDGATYTGVGSGTLAAQDTTTWATHDVPPQLARYVRVVADSYHGAGAGLAELAALGRPPALLCRVETPPLTAPGATWLALAEALGTAGDGALTMQVAADVPLLADDFAGPVVDADAWQVSPGATQGGALTVTGTSVWGSDWASTLGTFDARLTTAVELRVLPSTGKAMVGLRRPEGGTSYTGLAHAVYLDAGTLRVYEDGTKRADVGSYPTNKGYTVRFRPTGLGTLSIDGRPDGSSAWTALYDSTWWTGDAWKVALVVHSGTVSLTSARVDGPAWRAPATLARLDPATPVRLRATLERAAEADAAPVLDALRLGFSDGTTAAGPGVFRAAVTPGQGTHEAGALATDAGEAASPAATPAGFEVDAVPPAPVADLSVAPGPGEGEITLTWTDTGDDGTTGTAATLEVRASTTPFTAATLAEAPIVTPAPTPQAAGTARTLVVPGLAAGAEVTAALRARDDAGLVSALSNVATTHALDTTPPAVTITAPPEGAHRRGTTPVVTTATDAVGVVAVRLLVDGTEHASLDVPPWELPWDTTAAADGAHTLTVEARDADGNVGSDTRGLVADNTAPIIVLDPVTSPTQEDVTLVWDASDGLTPTELLTVTDQGGAGPPFTRTTEGLHELTLTATDLAGNSAAASTAFVIDRTGPAPVGDLTATPGAPGAAALAWTAPADALSPVTSYEVRFMPGPPGDYDWDAATAVGGAPPAPGAAGTSEALAATGLPPADTWCVALRSTDAAGNVSALSNVVVVDALPPTVAITAPADGATLGRPVLVRLAAADDVALDRIELTVDGAPLGTVTAPPWELPWDVRVGPTGPVTLEATAYDEGGLSAADAVSVTLTPEMAPAPTLLAPEDGSVHATGHLAAAGLADGWTDVDVSVDGLAAGTVTAHAAAELAVTADDPTLVTRELEPSGIALALAPAGGAATNLALASAGGVAWGGSNPAAAIDGSTATSPYWSVTATQSETLTLLGTVTLAETAVVDRVRMLLWNGDTRSYYNYRIAVSDDGVTWNTWVDRTGSGEDYQGWQDLPGEPTVVRHVRVWLSGSTANTGAHVIELQALRATGGLVGFATTPVLATGAALAGRLVADGDPAGGAITASFEATRDILDERFEAASLPPGAWAAAGATLGGGAATITGVTAWGSRYLVATQPVPRTTGTEAWARLRSTTGSRAMFGLQDTSDAMSYTNLPYALYLNAGTLSIYEGGTKRSDVGTYTQGQWLEARVRLGALQGATYEVRPEGATAWTVVYTSTYGTDRELRWGVTVYDGTVDVDRATARARAWSPAAEVSDADVDPGALTLRAVLSRPDGAPSPTLTGLRVLLDGGAAGPGLGLFRLPDLDLAEGTHTVAAVSKDVLGSSAPSNGVTVHVDSGPPDAITDLAAEGLPGGVALLTWSPPADEPVASYAVYRSAAPITDTLSLTPVATVTDPGLVDPVGTTGVQHYAVVAFDGLGNASGVSNDATVTLDAAGPTAAASVDPSPPLGPGAATVTFTLSEAVTPTPTFTWTPPGGAPEALTATQAPGDPLVYTAPLVIGPGTPSGTGTLAWSGEDLQGNGGSALTAGAAVAVDTTAPTAAVTTAPASPVGPGTLAITLVASEPLADAPTLTLTPAGGAPLPVTVAGGPTTWTGTLPVDGATGDGAASFAWQGIDAAGNPGTTLTAGASLTVDTTPPDAPTGLAAAPQPGGWFTLTWTGPAEAGVTWRLYRGEAPFATPAEATPLGAATTPTKKVLPPDVGDWVYAVSAVDLAGNEGPLSAPVTVAGSPPPPEDPGAVAVTTWATTSLGVAWTPSANTAGLLAGYRLYRSGALVASVGPDVLSAPFTALAPGKAYTLRVAAFDDVGKEGPGTETTGVTLVPNPASVGAAGHDRRVDVTWPKAVPETQLAHYAVYVSTSPIITVDGLAPAKTAPPGSTVAALTNLPNDVPVWVAVASVNTQGKQPAVVPTAGATPHDDQAPAKPGALVVSASRADALDLLWGATPDPGDLAGYELLRDGVVAGTVGPGETVGTLDGLAPATAYGLGVRSFDDAGNRSAASAVTGVTLVPNPTALTLTPHDKSIAVAWVPTAAPALMQGWAIYAQPAPFVTVAGLAPTLVAAPGATQATVGGLTNGQPWYVAVTARNTSGGEPQDVTPASATPFDDAAPPPPSGLKVATSGATTLGLSFTPSPDPDGDVAGGHILVDGLVVATVGPDDATATVDGLSPATAYALGVTAFDALGHESAPAVATGYTLVPNPADLTLVEEAHERLTVSFTPPPASLVDHLSVYAAAAPYTSVVGLKAVATLAPTATSATVTGLPNGAPAWIAVAATNKSGGQDPAVTPVSGTPQADEQGPAVSALSWSGAPLDAAPLTTPGAFSATLTDPAGVAFARFRVDGAVVGFDSSPTGGWTATFAPATVADGAHVLTVEAEDALGNPSSVDAPFTVQLPPPPAPTVTAPTDGLITAAASLLVAGKAQPGATVTPLLDGQPQPQTAKADGAGSYSVAVPLTDGAHTLAAVAANSAGSGPASAAVGILVDTSAPVAPGGLTATAHPAGAVELRWLIVGSPPPSGLVGFRVYRAAAPFDDPAAATLISGASPQAAPTLNDTPGEGDWVYRVTAVSGAGVESPLSAPATATADATPPTASITWSPSGPHEGDRVGPGLVAVTVTVSEPLVAPPFLALTPAAGVASPIPLAKSGPLAFSGSLTVTPTTPSGPAQATISLRDLAGNQGTAIEGGATLLLDTDAPTAALAVAPAAPIPNPAGAPAVVSVTVTLDEPLPVDAAPTLTWRTTESHPDPAPLPLAQTTPTTWIGGLLLPTAAGETPESLAFSYEATDDLGNTSTKIEGPASFEVYQGALPALAPPGALSAEALPAGEVALTWAQVPGASGYEVRRQGPGDTAPTPIARVGGTSLLDAPGVEGEHLYEVASVRTIGADEALSAPAGPALVTVDATPPDAPAGLTLSLGGQGVTASWDTPPGGEALTWALYRGASPIVDPTPLTPLLDGLSTTTALDPSPSPSALHYAVVARDAAGNTSPPAGAALEAQVLPVGSLTVTQADGAPPEVAWTHAAADLQGFRVSVDGVAGPLVEATRFVDEGWIGSARSYEVTPVAASGDEGPPRAITLPALDVSLPPDATLPQGGFGTWQTTLTAAAPLSSVRVTATVGASSFESAPVSVPAGAPTPASLAVTSPGGLAGEVTATLDAALNPAPGEAVHVVRHAQVTVLPVAYAADVLNTPLSAGASGSVRLSLSNPTDTTVEVVTARSQGAAPSDEVRFRLEDSSGNVLASVPLHQVSGDPLITLFSGTTVARLAPGETWLSAPTTLAVPAGAPSSVRLRAVVDHLHHGLGDPGALTVAGPVAVHTLSLEPPPYDATLTAATPALSDGSVPVELAGTAITPTGAPAVSVPVVVTVERAGFERTYTVITAADGTFAATFEALPEEAGVFHAWANAKGVVDKSPEVSFTITRVTVSPTAFDVTTPFNYTTQVPVTVATSAGNALTDLRAEPGPLPTGITLTAPAPKSLPGGATVTLPLALVANSAAPATATLTVTVRSAAGVHATLTLKVKVLPALPALSASPPYVETGVARGSAASETVKLTNTGLAPYGALTATLRAADGSPAPSWAFLATPPAIGKLDPGASATLQLYVSPPESVAPTTTPIALALHVTDGPKSVLDVPVWVTIDDSGAGSALVKVVDIYTGTPGPGGQLIQGLAGAKVVLTKVLGTPAKLTATTDAAGEAYFTDVPTGLYQVRASASGHSDQLASLSVKPGLTAWTDLLLPIPAVTIEWEVVETTIQDAYDIVLSATFETDVPGAVLVFTPPSIAVPGNLIGSYNGEVELKNVGTIAAQNVQAPKGSDGPGYKVEVLAPPPTSLPAGASVKLPVRVTPLGDLEPCKVYSHPLTSCYDYKCAYGKWIQDCSSAFVTAVGTGCTQKPSGGSGSKKYPPNQQPPFVIGPAVDTSQKPTGGYASKGKPITGGVPLDGEVGCDKCEKPGLTDDQKKCCKMGQYEPTGSAVSLLAGGYVDEVTDLTVAARGTDLLVRRFWRGDRWEWNHDGSTITTVDTGGEVAALLLDGSSYGPVDADGTVFASGSKTIARDGAEYLWSDARGEWRRFDADGQLVAAGDSTGPVLSYVRDTQGAVTAILDNAGGELTVFERDVAGHPTAVTDRSGRRVEYAWQQGRLATVVDVLGHTTAYTYDAAGHLIHKAKPTGYAQTITYGGDGLVASVLDQDGVGRWFTYAYNSGNDESYAASLHTDGTLEETWYDGHGQIIRKKVDGADVLQPEEATTTFSTAGAVTTETAADGTVVSVQERDEHGHVTRRTDARGLVSTFEYDTTGALILTVDGVGTASERSTAYVRDDQGQVVEITVAGADGASRTTLVDYDEHGNPARIVDPSGRETLRTYDVQRHVTSETDDDGVERTWDYDAAGRLVAERVQRPGEDPLTKRSVVYALREDDGEVVGERWTVTDAAGGATTVDLDRQGRPVAITDPWGRTVERTLDAHGRPVVDEAWDGARWEYSYETLGLGGTRASLHIDGELVREEDRDAYGRVVRVLQGALESQLGYEGARAVPSEIATPYGTVTLEHDLRDRPTRATWVLPEGETLVTQATWDLSKLLSATEPTGGETAFVRDAFGRVIQRIDPVQAVTEQSYDSLGGLQSVVDANGLPLVEIQRDGSGAIVRRTLASGRTIDYARDAQGRVVGVDDSTGTHVETTRDVEGHPLEQRVWAPGEQDPGLVFTWSWDAVGRPIASTAGGVSRTVARDDEQGRETVTTDFGTVTGTWAVERDRRGWPRRVEAPGAVTEHTWTPEGQLASVTVNAPGEAGQTSTFAYPTPLRSVQTLPGGATVTIEQAGFGRVRSIVVRRSDGTVAAERAWSWNGGYPATVETEDGTIELIHDAAGRVLAAHHPTQGSVEAAWDGAGNRTAGGDGPWTYGQAGELLAGGGATFAYDAAGNVSTITRAGGTTALEHDPLGRLVRAETPSGAVVTYVHDGDGLQVGRTEDGQVTWSVYGDQGLAAELDADGIVVRTYGWTPGAPWQTAPLFLRTGGQTWWFVNDHLDAPWLLVSSDGDIAWRLESDPFGLGVVGEGSTVTCDLRASGQIVDPATGLHLNTFRIYDPRVGRYLEPDPLLEEGGTNLYAFAEGAPTWATDPLGLKVGAGAGLSSEGASLGVCASFGAYAGVGGEGSVCLQSSLEPCCTGEGEFVPFGQSALSLSASAEYGIGLGGNVGGVGLVGKGLTKGYSAGCSLKSKCGDRTSFGDFECCQANFTKAGSFGIGIGPVGFEATLGYREESTCYKASAGALAGFLYDNRTNPSQLLEIGKLFETEHNGPSDTYFGTKASLGIASKDEFYVPRLGGNVQFDQLPGEAMGDSGGFSEPTRLVVPEGTRLKAPLDQAADRLR